MKETNTNEGTGRLPNDRQHEARPQDISHVDRQEGTMNHGALGGNFEEGAKHKKEETPKTAGKE